VTGAGPSADVLRVLGSFVEPPEARHFALAEALRLPAPDSLNEWRVLHTRAFIDQCHPYASVYAGPEGAIGGEAMARIGDFQRTIGAQPCPEPDHLTVLMGCYARLCEIAGEDTRARHPRRVMLWEHLLSWLPPYLLGVCRSAPEPYAQWGRLMLEVFQAEAQASGEPESLPLHLSAAPPFEDEAGFMSRDAFLAALLTPVRSGLVITQHDLSLAAQLLNVSPGFGGRRFLLQTLIGQKTGPALRWLACEARRQADAYAHEMATPLGDVAGFWRRRALATADALNSMESTVGGLTAAHMPKRQIAG